jgi:glutathione S-transferase
MSETLRVYTFSPLWGLPTSGPFGLKLEMALRMAGVAYRRVVADNPAKGPKRKSPWIEQGDVRIGDTTMILRHLGVDLESGLDARARAEGLALRSLLEEHWHQVLEYELFVDPIGRHSVQKELGKSVAPPMAWLVARMLHRHFRRHLVERGIARHAPQEIEFLGHADIDAVVAWLEGRTWALGDRPTLTDASLFGLLAPAAWSTADTPAFGYVRRQPTIIAYLERARAKYFPEVALAGVGSKAGSGVPVPDAPMSPPALRPDHAS